VKDEGRVRFGCRIFLGAHESFGKVVERARFCEKYGFDSVLIDDHLLYGTESAAAPETFTTLTAVGLQTEKIRVGVAVTDLVRRHPAIVAQTLATLSSMLPGRVFLGLGTGDPMNQTPFGLSSEKRFSKLKEGLKLMNMLWMSSIERPATYKGRFFSLRHAYLQMGQASRKRPPIYLAAFGKKMLRLTGEAADGWIPHCHTPKTYKTDLEAIRASASRAGRRLDSFVPAYYTLASTSSSREEANRNVLGPAKYFLALIPEGLRKVAPSADHPGRVWEKLPHPKDQRETIRKIAITIPEKTALATVIHGTPSDCIDQIAQFMRAGCKEMMLTFVPEGGLWSIKGLLPMIRFFSEKVISYFRSG